MAWDGRVPILLIGGGMISQDVIIPTIFQEQDRGVVGEVSMASRRASTLRKVRDLFPDYRFRAIPIPMRAILRLPSPIPTKRPWTTSTPTAW